MKIRLLLQCSKGNLLSGYGTGKVTTDTVALRPVYLPFHLSISYYLAISLFLFIFLFIFGSFLFDLLSFLIPCFHLMRSC